MPDDLSQYGPWGALAVYFLYKELWPFLRDKLYPDFAKAANSDREREDRVFQAFTANTAAVTSLQLTLGSISDQMREMAGVVRELNEDVAGLYGSLQRPRPSRNKAGV